jgi:hypothetical protein
MAATLATAVAAGSYALASLGANKIKPRRDDARPVQHTICKVRSFTLMVACAHFGSVDTRGSSGAFCKALHEPSK